MAELETINILEPQKKDLANLLKGVAILMKYDCTASKSMNRDSFSIEVSVDSPTKWQYNE